MKNQAFLCKNTQYFEQIVLLLEIYCILYINKKYKRVDFKKTLLYNINRKLSPKEWLNYL